MQDRRAIVRNAVIVLGALAVCAQASGQSGAVFHVHGQATTGAAGMWGNAILDAVEFPTGDIFSDFVTAEEVTDFDCPPTYSDLGWSVSTGTACTTAEPGWFMLEDEDGNGVSISDNDRELFNTRILDILNDRNLNSLVHLKDPDASFVIKFGELIRDNDPLMDNFGEVLYFERGTGAGNSTAYIQAVDEDGVGLGPIVTIDGDETLPTTPLATIGTPWAPSMTDQTIGGATIDLTRLGVTTLRYLRVYNGTSDPDLKIFAVWTQPRVPDPVDIFD